jgi:outer membrane lipoprotein carrier protein
VNPQLSLLLIWLFATQSLGDALPYVKRFETMYRQKRMMKATFLETYTENGHVTRREAGVAYFLRPGKMRWEYQTPEKNLFVSDGKNVWFYVPADHTVTRVPARQSTDWRTPFVFLAGEMKLSRLCARWELATQDQPSTQDDVLLSCKLPDNKPAANPARADGLSAERELVPTTVLLEIVRSSGELVRVVVRDPGGVAIEFQFTDWRMNVPANESLFHFSPPLGVALVDGFAAQDGH